EPAALRPAGVRAGTGRRLQHRIQLDEICAVLHGRILQHDRGFGDDGHTVLRGLDVTVVRTGSTGDDFARRRGAHRHFPGKAGVPDHVYHLGAVDVAALPVRSIDGFGLAAFHPAGAGEHCGDGVVAVVATLK